MIGLRVSSSWRRLAGVLLVGSWAWACAPVETGTSTAAVTDPTGDDASTFTGDATASADSGTPAPDVEIPPQDTTPPALTGSLSVQVSAIEPVVGATVFVYAMDGTEAPVVVGQGTTDAAGQVTVSWTMPEGRTTRPDLWWVEAQVAGEPALSSIVDGGSNGTVYVQLLSTWAVTLAIQLTESDGSDRREAWATAKDRINQHFMRPNAVDVVSAGDAAASGAVGRIRLHVGRALDRLSAQQGLSILELNAALVGDLRDGVFDAVEGDGASMLDVLDVETTRYHLAEAMWLGALDEPDELEWLLASGGLISDVSTDDGPLYPAGIVPVAFEPPSAVITWLPPQVADGAWFHDTAIALRFAVEGTEEYDLSVPSPEGATADEQPDGSYEVLLEAADYPDGPLEVGIRVETPGDVVTATRTVGIDHTAPVITATSWPTPAEVFEVAEIDVIADATDAGAGVVSVVLSVDGEAVGAPSTGLVDTTLTLADGPHTLSLKATDGVQLESEEVVEIVVDTTPPSVQWAFPVDGGAANDQNMVLTGTASDPVHPVQEVRISINGGAEIVVPVDDNGAFSLEQFVPGEGPMTMSAVAVDAIGQQSPPATVSFYMDVTPPVFTVPPSYNPWVGAAESLLQAGCNDTGSGVVSVSMTYASVGTVAMEMNDDTGRYEANVVFPGIEAQHGEEITIIFTALDQAGNQATATVTPTVDTVPPTIDASALAAYVIDPASAGGTAFVLDELSGAASVTMSTSLAEQTADLTGSPSGAITIYLEMSTPSDTLTVVGMDRAGNLSETYTQTVAIDVVPPVFTVDAPEYGTPTDQVLAPGTESVTLTGVFSDDASGPGTLIVNCVGEFMTDQVEFGPLVDGAQTWSLTVSLDAGGSLGPGCAFNPRDAAGNLAPPVVVDAEIDDTPPSLAVNPGSMAWQSPGAVVQVSGTVQDANGVEKLLVEVGGVVTEHPMSGGDWTVDVTLSATHGATGVSVQAVDIFGNISSTKTATFQVDAEPPNLTGFSMYNPTGLQIDGVSWTKEETVSVNCKAQDALSGPTTICIQGQCAETPNSTVDVSLVEGENTIECSVSDIHGNTTNTTGAITRDATNPTVTTDFVSGQWFPQGPVTVTGSVADSGVGVKSLSVGYGSFSDSIPIAADGSFTWTGNYTQTGPMTFIVSDLLNNADSLGYTVQVDVTPPVLTAHSATYLWALGMDVVWDGDVPTYTGDTEVYDMPDECYGEICLIHKFPTRARYAEFGDIAANNLPHWRFTGTDAESDSVVMEYRFLDGDGPMTDWRPMEVGPPEDETSYHYVVWAIDSFSDDPDAFELSTATAPTKLEVRATDAQGLGSGDWWDLDTTFHTPPLRVSDAEVMQDGTEFSTFQLADGSMDDARFDEHQMLAAVIDNPWDAPIQYRLDPGWYEEYVTGRREWMIPNEASAATCNEVTVCDVGQCILLWPGSDFQCTAAPAPPLETEIVAIPREFDIEVYDDGEVVPTTLEDGVTWRTIGPGETHYVSFAGSSTCWMRHVTGVEMVDAGGGVTTRDITIYDPDLGCYEDWSVSDAGSACTVAAGCALSYLNPYVIHSVTYELEKDERTLLTRTRMAQGESSVYFEQWFSPAELILHYSEALPTQTLEPTVYSPF